jgi:hypothetical protein
MKCVQQALVLFVDQIITFIKATKFVALIWSLYLFLIEFFLKKKAHHFPYNRSVRTY